jgi:cytochrome oxidase Cu insertion factor (SCO1/SenC/PrrC family)
MGGDSAYETDELFDDDEVEDQLIDDPNVFKPPIPLDAATAQNITTKTLRGKPTIVTRRAWSLIDRVFSQT